MQPLINLKAFLAVLVILIVPAALLVAYFRNYSPMAGGHDHGERGNDGSMTTKNSDGAGHAAMGHGEMPEAQDGRKQSPHPPDTSRPPVAPLEKEVGHAAMGREKPEQSVARGAPPQPGTTPDRTDMADAPSGLDLIATSALPGFPGLSRLAHIGATGFFLNHSEQITLTNEQLAALSRLRLQALLNKSTAQRKIDQAEQELWELTGADEPDLARIQAELETLEELRGAQRLAFIRTVGEAVKVLTDEQRRALKGL